MISVKRYESCIEYFAKVDVEFQDAEEGSQKKVLILSGVPESELF